MTLQVLLGVLGEQGVVLDGQHADWFSSNMSGQSGGSVHMRSLACRLTGELVSADIASHSRVSVDLHKKLPGTSGLVPSAQGLGFGWPFSMVLSSVVHGTCV